MQSPDTEDISQVWNDAISALILQLQEAGVLDDGLPETLRQASNNFAVLLNQAARREADELAQRSARALASIQTATMTLAQTHRPWLESLLSVLTETSLAAVRADVSSLETFAADADAVVRVVTMWSNAYERLETTEDDDAWVTAQPLQADAKREAGDLARIVEAWLLALAPMDEQFPNGGDVADPFRLTSVAQFETSHSNLTLPSATIKDPSSPLRPAERAIHAEDEAADRAEESVGYSNETVTTQPYSDSEPRVDPIAEAALVAPIELGCNEERRSDLTSAAQLALNTCLFGWRYGLAVHVASVAEAQGLDAPFGFSANLLQALAVGSMVGEVRCERAGAMYAERQVAVLGQLETEGVNGHSSSLS